MRWFSRLGFVTICLAVLGLIISAWPVVSHSDVIPFTLEDGRSGELTLVAPEWLKVGDVAKVELHITFDQQANDPIRLELSSRLEIGLLELSPKGESTVLINPDKPLTMLWKLHPSTKQEYHGDLWLLRQTKNGDHELILAREMIFESRKILGLDYSTFRWIGVSLLAAGGLLIAPVLGGIITKIMVKLGN